MNIVWYWWGFRLYVDDSRLHQLMNALQQGGRLGVENFLKQLARDLNYWWLDPLAPLIGTVVTMNMDINQALTGLRWVDSNCGHRGVSLTIPWLLQNSYNACR